VQHIVFGLSDTGRHGKIRDNVIPVTVLASFVLASIAFPLLPQWAGPMAVAQAHKPKPAASEAEVERMPQAIKPPSRAHTVNASSTRSKRSARITSAPDVKVNRENAALKPRPPLPRPASSSDLHPERESPIRKPRPSALELRSVDARLSSSSLPLPEMRSPNLPSPRPSTPNSAGLRPPDGLSRRHSHRVKTLLSRADMTLAQKSKLLRQHYFRSETAFLTALENISSRLVNVPKQARLSALRAELALIAQDLPAEVDIPIICPPCLTDGSPSKSRHHRIVRLNPAESTVLNSAEKVPYLLMVEILREDFTFDPESQDNQRLLATLLAEQGNRRRLFDLSDATAIAASNKTPELVPDSVFEPASGDLGNLTIGGQIDETTDSTMSTPKPFPSPHIQRLSSGATTISTVSDITSPRNSGASTSRSSTPPPSKKMLAAANRTASVDQLDFSALATHMRTASSMLAQLQAASGKRPRAEVAAIRAKIIASMQSLEEQSFDLDDGQGPTFDMIMAKATAAGSAAVPSNPDLDEVASITSLDVAVNAGAGAARMENDIKTGGLQRKGDRDDPSAAVFGEAWSAKKERIRKASPYGWMKNWDLVSVIVKTGADLRQEAFATQLIAVCHKIWLEAKVPVWVKLMRILVTGESSGLIETITNGVSLHSIKRNLTMSMNENTPAQRRRFATLKDHFDKAFGPAEREAHRAGVDAFKRSLAAYSMISYVLQLKDRHNGNILIDNEGHIIHIDFGFMLSNSPGSVGFEAAPFKLTYEYVEVLGGLGSPDFEDFKRLCKQAFQGKHTMKHVPISLKE
jgi:phosphatidylinositol 4-kinase B